MQFEHGLTFKNCERSESKIFPIALAFLDGRISAVRVFGSTTTCQAPKTFLKSNSELELILSCSVEGVEISLASPVFKGEVTGLLPPEHEARNNELRTIIDITKILCILTPLI
jgi:hypothetical protein